MIAVWFVAGLISMDSDLTISTLRDAVKLSPDNVPLREHLANTLLSVGRYDEAEKEFSAALAMQPENARIKLGFAQSSYHLAKYSQALVILEDLIKRPDAPGGAHLLLARLFLNDGSVGKAQEHYRKAVSLDPKLADGSLADQLSTQAIPVPADGPARTEASNERDFHDDELELDAMTKAERPKVTFDHVGGMTAVKEQIRMKIIYPITNASMFAAYGKKIGGGILMYGPPGCGKTHLARATAGEIKASFISVGIADVLDMWIGSSERNLHELFEHARRIKPCVIFFDEVDALAASRADMRTSSTRQIINQFLLELDGVEDNNEGVLILGATNAPWHLDSAFRRPGRFDRIIFVPPPDAPARAEIFRIVLKDKPVGPNIDFQALGKKTEKFSGADIQNVVDITIEKKLEEAMKTGLPKPITTADLDQAIKKVRPSTLEWIATAKNYAMYSNQGGVYDDVLAYLKTC